MSAQRYGGEIAAKLRPIWIRARAFEPGVSVAWAAAAFFAALFGWLAVRQHDGFGTYAFDLGIYDQGFWLTSRGRSFITVRGIGMWGHHLNFIALAYVPLYWLGGGARLLVATQAAVLGIGAVPVFLLARQRFNSGWYGVAFAVAYLLYPPVEWLTWVNFHPEALAVTPLLFAWWYLSNDRVRPFVIFALVALATREDVALVLVVLAMSSQWYLRRREGNPDYDADRAYRASRAALYVGIGALAYYMIAIEVALPFFNHGQPPFYIRAFYGEYGTSGSDIALGAIRRPDRIVEAAARPDRLRFYRDLLLPWGGLPLAGLPALIMAGPQLLASTIANVPYPRSIRYQYTSVMIAPITIAAVEGFAWLTHRWKRIGRVLLVWMAVCMWTSNTAWSPAPWGALPDVWVRPTDRSEIMAEAIQIVPSDASVAAQYHVVPHLTHRNEIYDWPNPWSEANWGVDDGYRYPDPASVEWVVADTNLFAEADWTIFRDEIEPYFTVEFSEAGILVARRTGS